MAEKERRNKNLAQRTIFRISVCFTEPIQIFEFIFPLTRQPTCFTHTKSTGLIILQAFEKLFISCNSTFKKTIENFEENLTFVFGN
jgi:hypothetical protein